MKEEAVIYYNRENEVFFVCVCVFGTLDIFECQNVMCETVKKPI